MYRAGQALGVGKTAAVTAIHQITTVLQSLVGETVRPPANDHDWQEIGAGFERIAGVPGVIGAIDGCLIRIMRFCDFDGCIAAEGIQLSI